MFLLWGKEIMKRIGTFLVCIMLIVITSLITSATFVPKIYVEKSIIKNIYFGNEFKINDFLKEESNIFQNFNIECNISIIYPVIGKFYNHNYEGVEKVFLQLLGISFVIDSSLEVVAQPTGSVDKVEFVLTTDNFQQELERKVDETLEHEKFSCRFYTISKFFGNYEVTAIAYYQGVEVARDLVEKIIFLKLGSASNKKPVAVAVLPSYVHKNDKVEFSASDSYDPDGEIVSYHWDFGDGQTSDIVNPTHVYDTPGNYIVTLTVTDDEGAIGTDTGYLIVLDYDFGVWIITKYQGVTDEEKLDIGIDEFVWMLHYGGGWRTYKLSMKNENDTIVTFRFGKTIINGINTIMTQLQVEVAGDTDLSKAFEVAMEFRFPYSLLEENQPASEDFFNAQISYSYAGSTTGEYGPHSVESFFYFGKQSFSDPGILRVSINPYFGDYYDTFPLTYTTSFLTVNGNGVEDFKRILSVEFDSAAHLTITSVPSQGKISYEFGDETAGKTTTISFNAYGGKYSNIIQRFILNPLPSDMSFDLTILGERSFKYEASNSYQFTYIMDSQQSGNLVKLELTNIPTLTIVSWGLDISLSSKAASGFVDLDMSGNIKDLKLYLQGSSKPFIKISNFPSKFRISSYIDVPNLKGDISISKYSGDQTTVSIPVAYDKLEITGTLVVNDGTAKLSFDLPTSSNIHASIGLDTNNDAMSGFEVSVVDTQLSSRILHVKLGGLATDNFLMSFDYVNGQIQNYGWSGKITKLIDLDVLINYQSLNFNIIGSWTLGEAGSFNIELNKAVELSLNNIDTGGFILSGSLTLNPGSNVSVQWQRGDPGYFIVETDDVQAEASLTFGSKYEDDLYIYADVVLNPNCYVKCDWDWGETGHFSLFTMELFTEFDFEALYNYEPSQDEYQYGFKIHKVPSIGDSIFTRTIQWDTSRTPVRIWILGDAPIPSQWILNVLWNYIWYPVPFN